MNDAEKNLAWRLGLIALLVLVAYGNILNHGFVWDDFEIIVNNPLLAKLSNVPSFFFTEDKVSAATGYYRPVTYLSFALDRALSGTNPIGYNVTNLVLHLLVVFSLYLVLLELFKNDRLALAAAAIFAVHPLAGESVNFHAGGRNTLLCACFGLLALLFYVRERRLASLVCFTLAIFSKEFALLLPAIFLFHDLRLREKRTIRVADYLPYLAAIGVYLTLRSFAVQKANFMGSFHFGRQLWLTPYLAVRYLVNMIFPFNLKVMYDEQTGVAVCVACLLLLVALVGAALVLRRQKEFSFSLLWFLLFLLPVVNIIPMMSATLIADRYAYLSLMGFAVALGALLSRANRTVALGAVVVICAVFTWVDIRQNSVWQDEGTLFTRMMQDAPGMSIGYRNLGLYHYRKGELAVAERYLDLSTGKADLPILALAGTASIFVELKKPDKAEPLLLKAIEADPTNPEAYLMLQMIYEQRGDRARAESYLSKGRQAIAGFDEERKREAAAFALEGDKFIAQGNYVNAGNILWRALVIDPQSPAALSSMGVLNARKGTPGTRSSS